MMEAHQFNVKNLEQTCFEVLNDNLCPENCIGLWQLSNACCLVIFDELQYVAFHFICENFEEVSLCEEFLQLEVQELADILDQSDLTVSQETTVYQSVLRWINHMPEKRQGAIATLLPKVRLGLMDKSYITDNVLNNDVVKTNSECHVLVVNTLHVMSQPLLLCSEPGINNNLFCHRLPKAILLKVGQLQEIIEAFDYTTNSWIRVCIPSSMKGPMTKYSTFQSTVFLRRYLYILGVRFNMFNPYNRVWRYNLVTYTWQEMSLMQEPRQSMSVTVLKGCIYAMGGFSQSVSGTAERYRPNINQWTLIASMNERRKNASCTTLNNKIYICGGGDDYIAMNSAEYYNPGTNQWTLITPMGTPRFKHGVVAYMGQIFAVGGESSYKCMRSAEAYDPVTNAWHNVSELVHPHCEFGVVVMYKKIFVLSCWMGKKIVECYNYTTNTWSVVFSGMQCLPQCVRCCVISGLPNMAEYCSPREAAYPEL